MVFSSLLFLFRFLPLFLALYFAAPKRLRNTILFIGSLIFYGWGEPVYISLLLFSTLVDFIHGKLVGSFKEKGNLTAAKWVVASSAVINLSLLIVFKYTDFFIRSFNELTGSSVPLLGLALPIGISFYTFQTMSYTIDVYRGEAPVQNNLISFGAYVSMFPQLIAGPIVRYQDIALELNCRQENLEQFVLGIRLFIIGLGKKVLLANQTGALWTEISAILPQERSILMVWIGILAFSFQIYFDFSGYSDMAVGMGHMLGFRFPDNFRYPYISKSITEFWRRWHISLGTWFKEYVYIPLGGNRNGRLLQVRNILIVWLLTGIWHGANLNFLLWGLYFGILLLLEKFVFKNWLNRLPSWIQHIYACLLVIFGWVLFAFEDMNAGFAYLLQMVGGAGLPFCNERTLFLLCGNLILLLISAVGSTPLPAKAASVLSPDSKTRFQNAGKILEPLFLGLVLFLSVAYLVNATYNPFLYFRF
ncbi:MAG: MBOAT family O-acyltransferase [Lachnospirales bacterium]